MLLKESFWEFIPVLKKAPLDSAHSFVSAISSLRGDSPHFAQARITACLLLPSDTFSHALSKIRLKKHGLKVITACALVSPFHVA